MQKKLTLRLDESLIQQAKKYSEKRGKSVSQIVADYFFLLDKKPSKSASELTPIVRSLKGVLRKAGINEKDYKQYLEKKYL